MLIIRYFLIIFNVIVPLAFTFLTGLTTLVLHLARHIIRPRKKSSPLGIVIHAIPTFTKSLYISQFTAYIFVLYLEFKDLNQSLAKLQFAEEDIKDCLATKKIMVKLRRRHELLCLSGRSLNRGFSAQILFIITVDFVIFVMDLYVWYVNLVDERFKRRNGHAMDTVALTAFALHVLARIVVISGICAVTKQEVKESLCIYSMRKISNISGRAFFRSMSQNRPPAWREDFKWSKLNVFKNKLFQFWTYSLLIHF